MLFFSLAFAAAMAVQATAYVAFKALRNRAGVLDARHCEVITRAKRDGGKFIGSHNTIGVN